MKRCAACGAENPPQACVCTACGAELPGRARFCMECGQPASDAESPTAPPARSPATAALPSPQSYTPKHLAEKILASRAGLEGERTFHEVLALAEELGMRPLQAHCHLGLGKLYRNLGRAEDARAELSRAVTLFREMAMTYWLPEAEAELATAR